MYLSTVNHLSSFAPILVALTCVWSSWLAAAEQVESLPAQILQAVVPELRVRVTHLDNGQERLAFLAAVHCIGPKSTKLVFNPFGRYELGRPFRIVLTDEASTIVHTIVDCSKPESTRPEAQHWVKCTIGQVLGRCFWQRVGIERKLESEHDVANLAGVPMGRYRAVLLVNERLVHPPPDRIDPRANIETWNESWRQPRWDDTWYASSPVEIEVDAQGQWHPHWVAGEQKEFIPLEADFERGAATGTIKAHLRLVVPEEWSLLIEGINPRHTKPKVMEFTIRRTDGALFNRFRGPIGSSYKGDSGQFAARLVPRGGIVGGTVPSVANLADPGTYEFSAELNDRIFTDMSYIGGITPIPPELSKEPTVVFRSQVSTIVVP